MLCAILGLHEGEAPPLPGSVLSFSPRTHKLPRDWEHVAGRRADRAAHFKGPLHPKSL